MISRLRLGDCEGGLFLPVDEESKTAVPIMSPLGLFKIPRRFFGDALKGFFAAFFTGGIDDLNEKAASAFVDLVTGGGEILLVDLGDDDDDFDLGDVFVGDDFDLGDVLGGVGGDPGDDESSVKK